MSTTIVSKNTAVKNRVPGLGELTRGESVVAHRTDSQSGDPKIIDTCIGIFIRVGRTEDDDASDQVVRIGPAVVTDSAELPTAVGPGSADDNQNWTGSLWWRKTTKEFLINTDGTREGWESVVPARQEASTAASGTVTLASLSDIYKGENEFKVVTAAGLKQYIDGVNAGTTYLVYVDPGNPNSSDSKANRGNVPERPFKSLQRALLEVTRRSFVRNPVGVTAPNDRTERMVVYLAPAVYELYNGRGGNVDISNYGRYRDAANLILLNRDYIVNQAIAAITFLPQSASCRRDLYYYIDGIANDIAVRGNVNTITNAKFIRNPDGSHIPAYDSGLERSETRLALAAMETAAKLAVKNLAPLASGGVRDLSIIVDPAGNPCSNVQDSISNLIDILDLTLETGSSAIYPHNPLDTGVNPGVVPNPGATTASFPNTGEPTPQNLQGFNNNLQAGIILPRGVSIVGPDLRKVIFRPTYVPLADGSEGKSSIFRMTGSNFFQGFTIKDKIGQSESAHNLSCFNFCTQPDLENYYDKVAVIFNDPTYYHQQQDAANLIQGNLNWISKKVRESAAFTTGTTSEKLSYDRYSLDILRAFVLDLQGSTNKNILRVGATIFTPLALLSGADPVRVSAESFWEDIFVALADYSKVAVRNAALVSEGGFVDPSVIADSENFSNPCINVQNTLDNFAEIITSVVLGDVPDALNIARFGIGDVEPNPAENEIVGSLSNPNTVEGSSPYIFSASLRSVRGMSGINGDGANVTGFKSYVAAQFTIVSLQTSTSAFIGTGSNSGQVASKRYKGTLAADLATIGDYRHFGYAVHNEAYAQLVSCFCIGPAIHYHCTSGAEFSITNSTSNFGDVSLQAEGYVGQNGTGGAYLQDRGYQWTHINRPKPINRDVTARRKVTIGNFVAKTGTSGSGTIELLDEVNFDDIAPYTLRAGSRLYISARASVLVENVPTFQQIELSATISTTVDRNSVNKKTINVSAFQVNGISNSWDPYTITGLSVYILRLVDSRSVDERVFKVRVVAPPTSRGRPLENFIFRFNYSALTGSPTYQKQLTFQQNKVIFVGRSEAVDEANRIYDLVLLNAFSNAEGQSDNSATFVPVIDLDYDPNTQNSFILDSPLDSLTYVALNTILTELGYSQTNRTSILSPNVNSYEFPTGPSDLRPVVEFNKPSIIRCGSQTWEYLGYYNYDTALPAVQSSILGAGLTASDAAALKLSKLQTEKKGGRIYATGLNEEGDFFIGSTRINTRTGESVDTRLEGTAESQLTTLIKVNLIEALTMAPQSTLKLSGGSKLNFEFDSTLVLDEGTPEVYEKGTRAFYQKTSSAENRRYGFARPATTLETQNEVSTDNRSNFISPANLAEWRSAKKLVSLREGQIPIYIGNWFNVTPVAYSQSYPSSFWPEPDTDIVALSKNPGLRFAPFVDLASAAAWANANLQSSETAVIYITPGLHALGGTFLCNVVINGIGNIGDARISTVTTGVIQSVLFYQELYTRQGVYSNRSSLDVGRQFLEAIHVRGILQIRGTGESRISNVGFISPIEAYNKLNPPANGDTKPAIERLIQAAIQRTYPVSFSTVSTALMENVNNTVSGVATALPSMFAESPQVPRILKNRGSLTINSVVFEPHLPYYSRVAAGSFTQQAHIRIDDGVVLSIRGVALRGNELFVIPRIVTANVGGTSRTYNIATSTNVGENIPGPLTSTQNIPTSLTNWEAHGFTSLGDGSYTTSPTHLTLFGHASAFISVLRGNNSISLRSSVITRVQTAGPVIRNFNSDLNNIRLESNHKQVHDTTSVIGSDLGTGNLGAAGNVDVTDFPALIGEVMGTTSPRRGPLISTAIVILRSSTVVTFPQTYTGTSEVAGWKGAFGYIPYINNQILQGSSVKCMGLSLTHANTSFQAASTSITRNTVDFWATAGTDAATLSSSSTTNQTPVQQATSRNVFWRTYTAGTYPGPYLTLAPGLTAGPTTCLPMQIPSSTNDTQDITREGANTWRSSPGATGSNFYRSTSSLTGWIETINFTYNGVTSFI